MQGTLVFMAPLWLRLHDAKHFFLVKITARIVYDSVIRWETCERHARRQTNGGNQHG